MRHLGEVQARLRVARWGVLGAPEEVEEYPDADPIPLRTVLVAERHAVLEAVAVTDIGLQVAGGPAFYRRSPLERAYRDVRGGPFHPTTPEATQADIGEAALTAARG